MPERSATHLVLIPSYNPGAAVYETVRGARQFWDPVWVVVDGSTDGTAEGLRKLAATDPGLRVLVLPKNRGKGAAVLHGISAAAAEGYTHALTMDSDAQHPAASIPEFMARSMAEPRSIVLGVPVFDASAPAVRVQGRKLSNWLAHLETMGVNIKDSLYGFRVYPIADLVAVMRCAALDAPIRLRPGGRGATRVARPEACQHRGSGKVSETRGGRRLALQLLPRQRASRVDAHEARRRAGAATAGPALEQGYVIPPLTGTICPVM